MEYNITHLLQKFYFISLISIKNFAMSGNLDQNNGTEEIPESTQKQWRMILDFNKSGLQCLSFEKTSSQAIYYFKKAEKNLIEQLKINPFHKKINHLASVTYNNLACYYKQVSKPKTALSYLKKALEIQVLKIEDWLSTASTHLNICAIYSFMNKHEQACEHAKLSISMLEKWQTQQMNKDQPESQIKTLINVKIFSRFNAAIENEHLKNYEQAIKFYQASKQLASQNEKYSQLIKASQQGIERVKKEQKLNKQKLIDIIQKRKLQNEKNHLEGMRKNKKNFPNQGETWRQLIYNRKYAEYKIHNENKNLHTKAHSVGKLSSIKPISHLQTVTKNNILSSQNSKNQKMGKI